MRRELLIFVALLFFASLSAAEVQYQGEVDRDKVLMNTSIELECSSECPVSSWRLTWSIPENAEILGMEDSLGEIEDYEVEGETVSISTNSGEPRRNETVRIRMKINETADNRYGDLYYRKFSIPGFRGEKTTGIFRVEDLVSAWTGFGVENSFTGEELRFSGEGPTNFRVNFGEGIETDYYEFFGKSIENTGQAYRISAGTTGQVQRFDRFPVAVMDDESFNSIVGEWSSGEYVAGMLTLRENPERNPLPVLAHETVHGLNDRFMSWDRTSSDYMDEGVAEYTEYLLRNKLYSENEIDIGPGELFGEETEYRTERDGRAYIYTVPSQGDRDRLWNYYQNDREVMKVWNPLEYPEWREFGYAYSDLLIRHYVVNNGSVRELYSSLDIQEEIENPETKWRRLSGKVDLTPCKYDSRERFDRCLDEINNYDYPVYNATVQRDHKELDIREIEIPNRTKEYSPGTGIIDSSQTSFIEFVSGFVDYILSLFQ